jgi:hypothetical protein
MDSLLWPRGSKRTMVFDRDKFKRLVQYVIWKAGKRDWFGATKLNKVLWFSDTRAYALTGAPITGATYIREQWGPVPKAIMPVRSELQREGAIRIVRDGKLERMTADKAPDMQPFTSSEIAIVDWWIEHIATYHTATSISDHSHDYTWMIATVGEEIPMFATFATQIRVPTEEEKQWGKEAVDKLGLP